MSAAYVCDNAACKKVATVEQTNDWIIVTWPVRLDNPSPRATGEVCSQACAEAWLEANKR